MKKLVLPLAAGIVLLSCATSKQVKKSGSIALAANTTSDTLKKDTTKKTAQLKPYREIITAAAITDDGLFKVHKIDARFYFEIPDSLLDKDILLVNRISKGSAEVRGAGNMLGFSGDWIGENVIRFTKGAINKLFIQRISFRDVSRQDSANSNFSVAVQNSNLQSIVAAFDVKALSPDSMGFVIDVTDYLNTDNDIFFFNPLVKQALGLGGIQPDRSYIQNIASYPTNLEIRTVKTYVVDKIKSVGTYELNTSMVLLPSIPMKPRLADDRIGYFTEDHIQYSNGDQRPKIEKFITRWRLEPRDEDVAKYLRGQLVEPKKPIVFYIDPATPKKWVPYLIQAVNDWQKAFEKAGFKNAIYAMEAPTNDSTWSLEDARHNAIVYKPSPAMNASGPHVADPRTGEILESHINWYHNVIRLLHDWYMVQAGAVDPAARSMQFNDTLMGRLIKVACSHEVGHTLGLLHNFLASSLVPVDSLRSNEYLEKNGIAPSIMDYARFNYVAQSGDQIKPENLVPKIGVYDEWAINWGYRWLPNLDTEEKEKEYMNKWIIASVNEDIKRTFGGEGWGVMNKREDVGDDPIKAGTYGIENLKRILSQLKEWATTPNSDYKDLQWMNMNVLAQYQWYLSNVMDQVGGFQFTPKTVEQPGPVVSFLSRKRQKAAIDFLNKQLFETPEWIVNREIFGLVGGKGMWEILQLQQKAMYYILTSGFSGFFVSKQQGVNNPYSFDEMLTDLQHGIWKELYERKPIPEYRRATQRIYMIELINYVRGQKAGAIMDNCDQANEHMRNLCTEITKALGSYHDKKTVVYLKEVQTRLKQALDYQKRNFPDPEKTLSLGNPNPPPAFQLFDIKPGSIDSTEWLNNLNRNRCWLFSETVKNPVFNFSEESKTNNSNESSSN